MSNWKDDRIGSALRNENPMVMARMRSGFAVMGDTQFIPGYCVLLVDDPGVTQLNDLDWERRRPFLFDVSLLGEAIERSCNPQELRRMNYAIMGNDLAVLHGHVHPRYTWEPEEMRRVPVWHYPVEMWQSNPYEDARHGELRATITTELEKLMTAAYQP